MTKQEAEQAVSPALLEAQAQLLAMRAQRQICPPPRRQTRKYKPASHTEAHLSMGAEPHKRVSRIDPFAVGSLPDHLGWDNQSLSLHMRKALLNQQRSIQTTNNPRPSWLTSLVKSQPPALADQTTGVGKAEAANALQPFITRSSSPSTADVKIGSIKLPPDIGVGMLRSKLAAPGRIWLLLRWIDQEGAGQLGIKQVRSLLCEQGSSIRICGWRQLRTLLAQGEDTFWIQHNDRLWLRSVPKVALALGIDTLSGHPVDLPVNTLLQGIGKFRAHLYASFHSGRKRANPISRAALARISQVSPRSQQNYEKRAQVRKHKNFAIGPSLNDHNAKEQAWRHGTACFKWHDHKRKFNTQKSAHLAWQLPNSYKGPHTRRPRGRQRQYNRELAVLSNKGMTGNDHIAGERQSKRYFDAAAAAVRTLDKVDCAIYWRGQRPGQWFYLEPMRE